MLVIISGKGAVELKALILYKNRKRTQRLAKNLSEHKFAQKQQKLNDGVFNYGIITAGGQV